MAFIFIHERPHPPFFWQLSATTRPLPPWDPITPIAFRFPNSVTVDSYVRSSLQRQIITKHLRAAGASLTNLLLRVVVKDVSSGLSKGGWVGLKCEICSNISISLSLWIPSSTLNWGRSSISSLLTVGYFMVHVSANQPSNSPRSNNKCRMST